VRFGELGLGDVFEAHGRIYQKLPKLATDALPEANAIDLATGRLAFFGLTVPVDIIRRDVTCATGTCGKSPPNYPLL
jgi:hypothetical protein